MKKQKEVQKTTRTENLNLLVYEFIKRGLRPSKICKILKIKKTALQYYLSTLKELGFIKKVSTMIFTDPPYSVNYVPEERRKGGRKVKELGGIMGDINFKILDLLNLIKTGICDGAVYVCCGSKQVGPIYEWAAKNVKNRARMIIWVKNGYSILPGDYHSAYEQMMYFYFDNKKFRGERNQSDVCQMSLISPEAHYEHVLKNGTLKKHEGKIPILKK